MKLKFINLVALSVLFVISCGKESADSVGKTLDVSGEVKGGYRHLSINMKNDSTQLLVYRGDYVKFYLDDGGDEKEDYPLNIPELGISAVLKDNTMEQPYFKMKTPGSFPLQVGEKVGMIEVVELEESNYREISAEEAWDMTLKNPPLLLDVRTANEFSRGHIQGATLLPLQELQFRAGELEQYKNQPVLIYCATGNRSTTASKILLDMGFKDIMNLRMGIMGWASKGYNIQF